jgi:hypothetical protein
MRNDFRLRSVLAAIVVAVGLAAASPGQAQEPLALDTASGTVIGTTGNGIESWLGIPYAAPPVGPLRWQPPQPATPWATPMKANTLPSSCAQNADLGVFARAGGNEDCLYLNIYRGAGGARRTEAARLRVDPRRRPAGWPRCRLRPGQDGIAGQGDRRHPELSAWRLRLLRTPGD